MILHGDCIEQMKTLEANSVDAIVTDPPYGWRFMGKAWDGEDIEKVARAKEKGGVMADGRERKPRDLPAESAGTYDQSLSGNLAFMEWTKLWATEAMRVLKPGGHALIFCGPRTYHAMAMGVEMAGFEIRDQLQWLFGSGFPKSHNVSKAIDKMMGAEREVIGRHPNAASTLGNNHTMDGGPAQEVVNLTAPATPEAKKWNGYGSALKPANEPICLARKPLEKGLTLAQNVLKYGTGALNIDGCRIESPDANLNATQKSSKPRAMSPGGDERNVIQAEQSTYNPQGRWPANVLFDEDAASVLDEQSGTSKSPKTYKRNTDGVNANSYGDGMGERAGKESLNFGDSGGASRFFKVIKQEEFDIESPWQGQLNSTTASTAEIHLKCVELLRSTALEIAAILARLGAESSSDTRLPFIVEILKELSSNDGTNTETIPNIVKKLKRELKLIEKFLSSRAKCAETQRLTDIITTTQNHLRSASFAEAVTYSSTSTKSAHGAKDFASRFIYQAKASKRERNKGLEGMPEKQVSHMITGSGKPSGSVAERSAEGQPNQNHHPTVKPTKLMEYLITLVCPEGAIVLDPFMGSGSTGVAAKNLNRNFIGIELNPDYVAIAEKRISAV